jgi:hypothetical protein
MLGQNILPYITLKSKDLSVEEPPVSAILPLLTNLVSFITSKNAYVRGNRNKRVPGRSKT